jgi:hypothetical protein
MRKTDSDGDTDRNPHVNSYGDSNSNANTERNTHGDTNCDGNADCDSYANSDADTYCDGNTDRDGDSNSYTYFDTETFTDAKIRANAQVASHAAAAPITIYENETQCSIRFV